MKNALYSRLYSCIQVCHLCSYTLHFNHVYLSMHSDHFPVFQHMFGALRDAVPMMKQSRHLETPQHLLDAFDREITHQLQEVFMLSHLSVNS